MDIINYFKNDNGCVTFDEESASAFAKGVAGDFNPIHDPGNKRFCVPGDLLFSVLLHHYGAAQTTEVVFTGMLDGNTTMLLPDTVESRAVIVDGRDRELLNFCLVGKRISDPLFVAGLSQQYVKFSGQTFPDILVPLMKTANVMINPARPLVIYKDMSLRFTDEAMSMLTENRTQEPQRDYTSGRVSLDLSDTSISVEGRKGVVQLTFDIHLDGESIGLGEKNMVLSGLREYEAPSMQVIVEQYNRWREDYRAVEHAV